MHRLELARRSLGLSLFVTGLCLLLAGRLFALQIGERKGLARAAYAQRTLALPLAARRGQILDRWGVPLTDPQADWGLVLFPALVQDRDKAASALVDLLGERLRPLLAPKEPAAAGESGGKTGRPALPPVAALADLIRRAPAHEPLWLASSLPQDLIARASRLSLPGLRIAPSGERYGPDSLARHLVGHLSDGRGAMGLERLFDQALAGDAVPTLTATLNARGQFLPGEGWQVRTPGGKEPDHLWTTIDGRVQGAVEAALTDAERAAGGAPFKAAVVVLDPESGEVLATASRPNLSQRDPLCTAAGMVNGCLLNRAVQAYPPGSIFKVPVAALALDRGLWTPESQVDCSGTYRIGTGLIQDLTGPYGIVPLAEGFAHSCNTPWAKLGVESLGKEGLQDLFLRFGFGQRTGTEGLWEEAAGTLPAMNWPGEVAQAAFGQGMTVTPLQMARVFAAVANGGRLPPIRLVEAVRTPEGRVVSRPQAEAPVRVMARSTAQALQQLLRAVTAPGGVGTGQAAWIPGWGSAGKTGTAEGVGAGGRPVEHAWFVGWAPLEKPRYVICVLIEEGGKGGMVAAPLFRSIGQGIRTAVGE
jgi:penicillin-binding protein 2